MRQRLRVAAENVIRLETELKAERHFRDQAIVELYEAHVRVDTVASDAHLSRARILKIVGDT